MTYRDRIRDAATRDEDGSALVLALILITLIGVLMAATLSFANTSVRATPHFVEQRNTLNDVDGIMDGAINAIRGSLSAGSNAAGPSSCGPFAPSAGADGVVVTVTCEPQSGSGVADADQPRYAILTLGDAANEGMQIDGNNTLTVDGSIYSNGSITQVSGSKGQLLVYGDVTAEGCDAGLVTSVTQGVVNCSSTNDAADPGYLPAVDTSQRPDLTMQVDPAASCDGNPDQIIRFVPGFYTEPPAPPASCDAPTETWWFAPGSYYFDFQGSDTVWNPSSNVSIFAGALAAGLSSTSAKSAVTIPGACDPAQDGAQFVFGGKSTLELQPSNEFEVCSPIPAAQQHIAVFGLSSGTRALPSNHVEKATTATSPVDVLAGDLPFSADPAASTLVDDIAVKGDGKQATALAVPGTTVSLSATDFETIPSGSLVSSASIELADDENPDINHRLVYRINGANHSVDVDKCALAAGVRTCDITTDLASAFAYRDFDGTRKIKVDYSANPTSKVGATDQATLDRLALNVSYAESAWEKACGPADCALLSNNPQGSSQNMYFHGTVYTPVSKLAVTVQNGGATIFDRGVICETLYVNISASSKQDTSPFSLPHGTSGRDVIFTAWIDVDGTPQPVLRAQARYRDFVTNAGVSTAFPGYTVTVTHWAPLR